MTDRFDPNVPSGPLTIQGDITSVTVTEQPEFGPANLVVNANKPFDIEVSWRVFGNLTPMWLTALSQASPNWVVTAYAESVGPGSEISLGSVDVPVGAGPFTQDVAYTAKLTVPPVLAEENPGDPTQSGVYRLVVTAFLDSTIGPFDMIGYAEGPVIKVEDPN